ncbi:GNAT family N-acetyltransferase [Rheinheimera metallidurans]|uniref:GNAT family N-acetyltransferase n=1 Tax=Rheinheimera metallidurans TaxID=2925781 RepID=UPI003001DF8D
MLLERLEINKLQNGWSKLSTLEQLTSIKQQWYILNKQCGDVLFCSPTWLIHWIFCYWQPDWQLEVWVFVSNGELVALLPCYSQPLAANAKRRVLYPLGQGEPEECEVASEFVDLLILPAWQARLLPELANKINASNVTKITWRAISANASILHLARLLRFASIRGSGFRYKNCKQIDLTLSSQIKRKWQKILRYEHNKKAVFSWLRQDEAAVFWPELKRLHQLRWQKQGKLGAFSCNSFNAFHMALITQHPECCYMSVLTIDNEPAAIHYYLESAGCLHFYQAGWSATYASLSPSAMLHLWTAQHSHCANYDFMMGGNISYKQELGNAKEACYQLEVYFGMRAVMQVCLNTLKRMTGRYK